MLHLAGHVFEYELCYVGINNMLGSVDTNEVFILPF